MFRNIIRFIFVVCMFFVVSTSCTEDKTIESQDFDEQEAHPLSKLKFNFSSTTNFSYGILDTGSYSTFVYNNTILYKDTLLSEKYDLSFNVGDTVHVLGRYGLDNSGKIVRNILGVEVVKNTIKYYGYLNENQLAIYFEKLKDNNYLLMNFALDQETNETQELEMQLLDQNYTSIQKLKMEAPVDSYEKPVSFYRYLNFEDRSECMKMEMNNCAKYFQFAFDACGYYSSEYLLYYIDRKIYLSPKLFRVGDADMFHEMLSVVSQCDTAILGTNRFWLSYERDTSEDSLSGGKYKVYDCELYKVNMEFNKNRGFIVRDTVLKRKYLDSIDVSTN